MPHDPGQRLQKALAHCGLGSRREIEAWIRAGRLTVNGAAAVLGMRVREADRIRLDGRLVRQRPAASQQVFLCHRSPGEPLGGRRSRDVSAAHARETEAERESAAAHGPDPVEAAAWEAVGRPDEGGAPQRQAIFERLPRTGGRRFIAVSPMPLHDGGLELATSDGEIAERLQRAVRRLTGEFHVRLRGELGEAQLAGVRTLDSARSRGWP
jgi:23S rRNA pseudouridine2605 synthase